ncbi:MAG: hypothetical protein SFV23_14785 [Planctomycetaceae bacterium]|nr:hypothetical protein [Planctomycetaceae bacterium]
MMNAPVTAETPREPPWLGRLCLWLACGLLTAWAADRVKPVFWYGPLFGVVFGGLAIALRAWFSTTPRRLEGLEVALLAMLGVGASLWIAAERSRAAEPKKTGNEAVAAALMAQLEQMPAEGNTTPDLPAAVSPAATPSVIERWRQLIARRYQFRPELAPAVWICGELLAAGGAAGIVTHLAALRRSTLPTGASQEPSE